MYSRDKEKIWNNPIKDGLMPIPIRKHTMKLDLGTS